MAEMLTCVLMWLGRRVAARGICLSFQVGQILRTFTISPTTTILDKNFETFYQITAFLGYQIYSFSPLPPIQCCQCWFVVKTKLDELQTPWNNIEQGEGGLNIFYMPISQDMRKKMCDIRLSQLVLSKIVALHVLAVILDLSVTTTTILPFGRVPSSCIRSIRSVIIRVINKIGRPGSGSPNCLIMSMITDGIGRHKILFSINHNCNKILEKPRQSKTCWRCITICHHCDKKVTLNLTFLGILSRFQSW